VAPRPAGVVHEPPRTDSERRIAEICRTVLGVDSIGNNENLFDLGANSLLASMIASRLMVAFGVDLPLTLIFELPTVCDLATSLSRPLES
jgi:acyl carrier protein